MKDKGSPLTIKDGVVVKCDKNATEVVIPDGVRKIGSSAFCWCESLESVVIPNGVTEIGEYAFHGCTSLENLTISGGVQKISKMAFSYCKSLKSVVIPDGVTSIGDSAFQHCIALKNVSIPCTVKKIGERAFTWCESLAKVILSESVTEIGEVAFIYCTSLASVTIPASVSTLGSLVFGSCTLLSDICFEGTVAQWEAMDKAVDWYHNTPATCVKCTDGEFPLAPYIIEDSVLKRWWRTEVEVVIPDGAEKIGDGAFLFCTSLASVTIPENVTEIGELAFRSCTSLSDICFEGTVAQWEAMDKAVDWYHNTPATCVKCADGEVLLPPYIVVNGVLEGWHRTGTVAVIPKGVTKIGNEAFAGCSRLASVIIPESVSEIGDFAFQYCFRLFASSIQLSDSVAKIGEGALDCGMRHWLVRFHPGKRKKIKDWMFNHCSQFVSLTILDGITAIGEGSFFHCEQLASLTISESVTEIGDSAFAGCESLMDIRYGGTMAEWESVEKGLECFKCVAAEYVHCADGDAEV